MRQIVLATLMLVLLEHERRLQARFTGFVGPRPNERAGVRSRGRGRRFRQEKDAKARAKCRRNLIKRDSERISINRRSNCHE